MNGTQEYKSPEILINEKYLKADYVYVFSFIVFEVMTGEVPYKNDNFSQLIIIP